MVSTLPLQDAIGVMRVSDAAGMLLWPGSRRGRRNDAAVG